MSKTNKKNSTPQKIIAGIQTADNSIEFFAIKATKEVMFLQNGQTHPFKDLPGFAVREVCRAYEQDRPAKKILSSLVDDKGKPVNLPYARQVELYIYYMYGSLDHRADMVDGKLQAPENFREATDCISLNFAKKQLHIDQTPLKAREVKMLDLIADEKCYKGSVIASKMGIAESTYDQHKRALMQKLGVFTTTALIVKAVKQQVVL